MGVKALGSDLESARARLSSMLTSSELRKLADGNRFAGHSIYEEIARNQAAYLKIQEVLNPPS